MPLLLAACESESLDEIKQVAHKMKGAAKMVGSTEMADQLQQLEDASTNQRGGYLEYFHEVERLTQKLQSSTPRMLNRLREHYGSKYCCNRRPPLSVECHDHGIEQLECR
ncbi:Hpt domain-containing protein [Vibrio chagasii]